MRRIILSFILVIMSFTARADTQFGTSPKRVVGSLDLIRFLARKFQIDRVYDLDGCGKLKFSSHIILGSVLPERKGRLVNQPEDHYVKWYINCVETFARKKMVVDDWSELNTKQGYLDFVASYRLFLGDPLIDWMIAKSTVSSISLSSGETIEGGYFYPSELLNLKWETIPSEIKPSIVLSLLSYLVGPEFVLYDLRYIGEHSVIDGSLQTPPALANHLLAFKPHIENVEDGIGLIDAVAFYSTLILSVSEILEH